jgi:hypothetical protein
MREFSAVCAYQRGEFERAEGLLDRAAAAADTAEAPVGLATGLLKALALAAAGPRSAAGGVLKLRAIRAELADCDPTPDFLRVALEDIEPRVLMAAGDNERARATLAAAREPFRDAFLLNGPAVRELLELQARTGTAHPALLCERSCVKPSSASG